MSSCQLYHGCPMIGKQVTFMIIPKMLRFHGFDIYLRLFRSFINAARRSRNSIASHSPAERFGTAAGKGKAYGAGGGEEE